MKTLTPALEAMRLQGCTSWSICWRVTDRLGNSYRATQHDASIAIAAGVHAGLYEAIRAVSASSIRSAADLAVDNLSLESVLDADGISRQDIDGGLFDGVSYVLFALNWQAPDAGQVVMRSGDVGELLTEAEGGLNIELRGLAQAFQQTIVRTYGPGCDAALGDVRCKVSLAERTVTGSVDAVLSARLAFVDADRAADPAGYFSYGVLTFTTGANAGFAREVRDHREGGLLVLVEPLPDDIAAGDDYRLTPGCDKTIATCKAKFDNVINFRGFPAIRAPDENVAAPVRG